MISFYDCGAIEEFMQVLLISAAKMECPIVVKVYREVCTVWEKVFTERYIYCNSLI